MAGVICLVIVIAYLGFIALGAYTPTDSESQQASGRRSSPHS